MTPSEITKSIIDSTIQQNAELNEIAAMLPEGNSFTERIHQMIADNNEMRK